MSLRIRRLSRVLLTNSPIQPKGSVPLPQRPASARHFYGLRGDGRDSSSWKSSSVWNAENSAADQKSLCGWHAGR